MDQWCCRWSLNIQAKTFLVRVAIEFELTGSIQNHELHMYSTQHQEQGFKSQSGERQQRWCIRWTMSSYWTTLCILQMQMHLQRKMLFRKNIFVMIWLQKQDSSSHRRCWSTIDDHNTHQPYQSMQITTCVPVRNSSAMWDAESYQPTHMET